MSVHKLSQEEELETTFSWLTEELKTKKNRTSKTIIYCQSINACGELYSMLDSVLDGDAISNIAMFHSKTPEALKTKVLDNFVPMDSGPYPGEVHGVRSHPPTGPEGPHFDTQYPS